MEAKSPKKKTTRVKNSKSEPKSPKPVRNTSKASSTAFAAMRQRDGPRAIGSRTIPTPVSGCLSGMSFIITGILDSIEREDAIKLIQACGGKVMTTLGKTCQYVICGRDAGPKKLEKAKEMQKIMLDEDKFFLFVARQSQLFLKSMSKSSNDTIVMKQTDAKKKSKTVGRVGKKPTKK